MAKFGNSRKWIVFTVLLGLASCVYSGKNADKKHNIRERSVGNERYICDFRIPNRCPDFIADERWKIVSKDGESFLQANFSQTGSSLVTYTKIMKPASPEEVQDFCIILRHFRDSEDKATVPKVFVGIEPQKVFPVVIGEMRGEPNEWKTDEVDMTAYSPFRLVFPVTYQGSANAQAAIQYFHIREGPCNSMFKTKYPLKPDTSEQITKPIYLDPSLNGLKEVFDNKNNSEKILPLTSPEKMLVSKKMSEKRRKRSFSPFGNVLHTRHELNKEPKENGSSSISEEKTFSNESINVLPNNKTTAGRSMALEPNDENENLGEESTLLDDKVTNNVTTIETFNGVEIPPNCTCNLFFCECDKSSSSCKCICNCDGGSQNNKSNESSNESNATIDISSDLVENSTRDANFNNTESSEMNSESLENVSNNLTTDTLSNTGIYNTDYNSENISSPKDEDMDDNYDEATTEGKYDGETFNNLSDTENETVDETVTPSGFDSSESLTNPHDSHESNPGEIKNPDQRIPKGHKRNKNPNRRRKSGKKRPRGRTQQRRKNPKQKRNPNRSLRGRSFSSPSEEDSSLKDDFNDAMKKNDHEPFITEPPTQFFEPPIGGPPKTLDPEPEFAAVNFEGPYEQAPLHSMSNQDSSLHSLDSPDKSPKHFRSKWKNEMFNPSNPLDKSLESFFPNEDPRPFQSPGSRDISDPQFLPLEDQERFKRQTLEEDPSETLSDNRVKRSFADYEATGRVFKPEDISVLNRLHWYMKHSYNGPPVSQLRNVNKLGFTKDEYPVLNQNTIIGY